MVYYKLELNGELGTFKVKHSTLKKKRTQLPNCDKEGNLVERRTIVKGEYGYFVKGTDTQVDRIYKKKGDKVIDKLTKTKQAKYTIVNVEKARDLRVEGDLSIIDCDELKQKLPRDKALEFVYTNGLGFKAYATYIYWHRFTNELIMARGYGSISELITQEVGIKEQTDEALAELNDLISLGSQVEQAVAEELLC